MLRTPFLRLASMVLYGIAMALLLVDLVRTYGTEFHASDAVIYTVNIYGLIHIGIGALLSAFCIWRIRTGYVTENRLVDLLIAGLWNRYVAATTAIVGVYPYLLSLLQGGGS